MLLRSLRLKSFRAHEDTCIQLSPKVNLLHGPNGAGKTNVLEAIHFLCLSKSFLASSDSHAVRRGDDHFDIYGQFTGEHRSDIAVRLIYASESGKRLFVNQAPLDRLSDVVGMFPVVVLAPEDYALTAGGPEERRRFLNNTLSQAWPAYMQDLLRYRRALKQRNALFQSRRRSAVVDTVTLDAWTEELVTLGARIMWRRHLFITQFKMFLDRAHRAIEAVGEEPSLAYETAVEIGEDADESSLAHAFRQRLALLKRRELERGRTLAGPHRDELVFQISGVDVRPYASQGQHRTFALALKLATFYFLKDHLEETPLLLLDDVFGILDPDRARVVLSLLASDDVGQSILTAARRDSFEDSIPFSEPEHSSLLVVNGNTSPETFAE